MCNIWTLHFLLYIFCAPVAIYEFIYYFFNNINLKKGLKQKAVSNHNIRITSLCIAYIPLLIIILCFNINYKWCAITENDDRYLFKILFICIFCWMIILIRYILYFVFLIIKKNNPLNRLAKNNVHRIPACWFYNLLEFGIVFIGVFSVIQRFISEYQAIIITIRKF